MDENEREHLTSSVWQCEREPKMNCVGRNDSVWIPKKEVFDSGQQHQ